MNHKSKIKYFQEKNIERNNFSIIIALNTSHKLLFQYSVTKFFAI